MINRIRAAIGKRLAAFLSKSLPGYRRFDTVPVAEIASVMQPANGGKADGLCLRQDMTLEAALASCISQYDPVPVRCSDGKVVGMVDPADLVAALQAEET